MRFAIVTLFPEMFAAISQYGVSGRAVDKNVVQVDCVNPRDYAEDKHRTVDDRPYGGGPGMVMQVEPLSKALQAARDKAGKCKVICMSPQGKPLNQALVKELAGEPGLIIVAGRYEGIDERFVRDEIDEEISLGDYVLSGGELAAMVLIDALTRTLPGVLGHELSAQQDSFSQGLLDCPHYTRPEEYRGERVPAVLLSGNHQAIARWRMKQSLGRTWQRRPELLENMALTAEQKGLLAEFQQEFPEKLEDRN